MQQIYGNKITINSEGILLNDFQIDEPKLVNLFVNLKKEQGYTDEQLRDKVIQLMNFGLIVDKAAKIDEKIDYVKEGFDSLRHDMENQIENNFSESVKKKIDSFIGNEGSFTKELQETFGDEGTHSQKIDELMADYRSKINSILDLNDENSPLKALESSIDEKFNRVMNVMSAMDATQKAEDKSPKKGAKFENLVAHNPL